MGAVMRIGSLFSGIGGLELGVVAALARLRVRGHVVWQAEKNPYARAVLAKHWPRTRRYEDVRDVDASASPVDLVCGGFPCQDLSLAGDRKGLAGERSGLWSEQARVICDVRPGLVFVENVPGLLAPTEREPAAIGRVLGDLADLGFDAAWGCFSAAEVGAPHLRRRVFILAWLADADRLRQLQQALAGQQGGGGARVGSEALAHAAGDGCEVGAGDSTAEPAGLAATPRHDAWAAEPDVGRVVDGFSSRLDGSRRRQRLVGLGGAAVRQQVELAFVTLARLAGLTEETGGAT